MERHAAVSERGWHVNAAVIKAAGRQLRYKGPGAPCRSQLHRATISGAARRHWPRHCLDQRCCPLMYVALTAACSAAMPAALQRNNAASQAQDLSIFPLPFLFCVRARVYLWEGAGVLHGLLDGWEHAVARVAEGHDAKDQRQRGPVGNVGHGAWRKAAGEERVRHLQPNPYRRIQARMHVCYKQPANVSMLPSCRADPSSRVR